MIMLKDFLKKLSARKSIVAVVLLSLLAGTLIVIFATGNSSVTRQIASDEVGIVVDDEITELIGNSPASLVLGGTVLPFTGTAEVLKGTANASGLVAVTVNDAPLATAIAPKSPFFELQDVPLSIRSTAVSQILMTPGIMTGDPLIDTLLVAAVESFPETRRVEENLRREARQHGVTYLSKLSPSTRLLINESAESLLTKLPNVLNEITPSTSTTTPQSDTRISGASSPSQNVVGQRLGISNTYATTEQSADGRPLLPATCDVGVKNYTGLEHDNLCITRVSGGGTENSSPTKFIFENRSPRWVLLYIDKPEISVKEALANREVITSSGSVVPDAAIAPKEWAFPDVLNLALRFATALADSSTANVAKEFLNYLPWVKLRASDDSLAQQLELKFREFSQDFRIEIEIDTSLKTRLSTVTAGLPRLSSYSGYINSSARDELRRLIATTGTMVSTIVVPLIRVILDLSRPTASNKACAFENQQRNSKTFVAMSDFVLDNAEEIGPFAEALIGASPDSYLEGVIKTAPNAIQAILTSAEPWTMIGYYLFSNCDESLDSDQLARLNSTIYSLGYDPGNQQDIIVEYASEEILSAAKQKIREAIIKRVAAMSTGWGALVQVVEAAPDLANFAFSLNELIQDSWNYDTEDSYFFVDEKGETLVVPPWPQQSWSVSHISSSDIELRSRADGTITLSSGSQLVVIDPATGATKRKYEVIGTDLFAYDNAGKTLWTADFSGLANFRLRDLTPKGHPILESSFFFFGSTLEVFNKDSGSKIGELSGPYAIGESIWTANGSNVSVYDADSLTLLASVEVPFTVDSLARQVNSPGATALVLGQNGESTDVDRSGKTTPVSSTGLLNDDGTTIISTTSCGGPIFRKDGKLTAINSLGELRWNFPKEGLDDVTKWIIDENCNTYVGNDDGRIWYIDKNAKNIWTPEGKTLRNRLSPISAITLAGRTLLAGSGSERELFALDKDTGQDLWRLPLDAGVTSILPMPTYVLLALSNGQVKRLETVPIQQTP